MKISDLGEDGLIRRVRRLIRTGRDVIRGIGDDCAVVRIPSSRGRHLLFERLNPTRDAALSVRPR